MMDARHTPLDESDGRGTACRHGVNMRDWVGAHDYQILWESHYRPERQTILDAVRAFAPSASGCLLDVGCGHKPYARLFLPYVQEYIGLDLVESAAGNDADVIGSVLALPFDDASFDTVIATQVIEHVAEPWVMMREIARVLRPGGRVLVTAPLFWPLHETPHDYYRYTSYGLTWLAAGAGLTAEQVTERGGFWSVLAQLFVEYYENYRPRRWIFRRTAPLVRRLRPRLFKLARRLDRRYPGTAFTLGYAMTARKDDVGRGQDDTRG